jgi:predicted  nucleic acid-binding Zn ribbon protein
MSAAIVADDSATQRYRSCPFCGDDHATTNKTTISDATYWRCHRCGQVWNPSRLRPLPEAAGGPRRARS